MRKAAVLCAVMVLSQCLYRLDAWNGPDGEGDIGGTAVGVLPGATAVTPLNGAHVSLLKSSLRRSTGSDGKFRLRGLPAGSYRLLLSHGDDGALALQLPIEVRERDGKRVALDLGDITLRKPGRIQGTVRAASGDASDAMVVVERTAFSVQPDATGAFALPPLGAGEWTVGAAGSAGVARQVVRVEPDAVTTVELVLQVPGSSLGTIQAQVHIEGAGTVPAITAELANADGTRAVPVENLQIAFTTAPGLYTLTLRIDEGGYFPVIVDNVLVFPGEVTDLGLMLFGNADACATAEQLDRCDAVDAGATSSSSSSSTGGTGVRTQRSCMEGATIGCGARFIEGGTFTMGGDPEIAASLPAMPNISVSGFWMDIDEVTVDRFHRYWQAGHPEFSPVAYPGGQTITRDMTWLVEEPSCRFNFPEQETWSPDGGIFDDRPVTCVSWITAMSFCAWEGGRLPTEAELEWALRGRPVPDAGLLPGRTYAWGNEVPMTSPCDRANVQGCFSDPPYARPVGSFPEVAGFRDQSGNVFEWAADRYVRYGDAPCWDAQSLQDPLCYTDPQARPQYRGGSFDDPELWSHGAFREFPLYLVSDQIPDIGIRCVYSN